MQVTNNHNMAEGLRRKVVVISEKVISHIENKLQFAVLSPENVPVISFIASGTIEGVSVL